MDTVLSHLKTTKRQTHSLVSQHWVHSPESALSYPDAIAAPALTISDSTTLPEERAIEFQQCEESSFRVTICRQRLIVIAAAAVEAFDEA